DVVAGIWLAGEPHAECDRAREAFRVRAAAGDGRLGAGAGGLRVIVEQAPDQFCVRIEDELRVPEVAAGDNRRAARCGELRDERLEQRLQLVAGSRRYAANVDRQLRLLRIVG